MADKVKIEKGDTVGVKGQKRHGTARVERVSGSTIVLETPLDQFRLWHTDDLELINKEKPHGNQEEA